MPDQLTPSAVVDQAPGIRRTRQFWAEYSSDVDKSLIIQPPLIWRPHTMPAG